MKHEVTIISLQIVKLNNGILPLQTRYNEIVRFKKNPIYFGINKDTYFLVFPFIIPPRPFDIFVD